jgi:N-dimethylarginine dimethylaminohydrolase
MLEPLLENSNATYFATPPPSPHYTRDELYLETGDIMTDEHNIYVGMSGNASTPKGVAWLKQLLEMTIWFIPSAFSRTSSISTGCLH